MFGQWFCDFAFTHYHIRFEIKQSGCDQPADSFNISGFWKILPFINYCHFQQSASIFNSSEVFGQSDVTEGPFYSVTAWKIWSPWTSPQPEFPPWRCSTRFSLQAPSVACCLWTFQHSVLSSVAQKHGWDEATDVATEEFSISIYAFKKSWVAFIVCLG